MRCSVTFMIILLSRVLNIIGEEMGKRDVILTAGYSQNVLAFNVKSWEKSGLSADGDNMSFMIKHPRLTAVVYAVHEHDNGTISRWIYDQGKGLKKLQVTSSQGSLPCHLACDADRNLLYVANYGGSFAAFKLNPQDGAIGDVVYEESYGPGSNVVPERQKDAHPHAVNMIEDLILVTDLGSDKIWSYRAVGDKIEKMGFTHTPEGWGPRHLAIHDKKYAYIAFELQTKIGTYTINFDNGELRSQDFVNTVDHVNDKGDPEYGAEILVHPNGKWVYFSNRGTGPLIVYNIDPNTGSINRHQVTQKEKVWPRHFAFSSDGFHLYLADQLANRLEVWTISKTDGSVSFLKEEQSENSPSVVLVIQT